MKADIVPPVELSESAIADPASVLNVHQVTNYKIQDQHKPARLALLVPTPTKTQASFVLFVQTTPIPLKMELLSALLVLVVLKPTELLVFSATQEAIPPQMVLAKAVQSTNIPHTQEHVVVMNADQVLKSPSTEMTANYVHQESSLRTLDNVSLVL